MSIIKQIKIYIILLVITSCSHIQLDIPKNEVIDKVKYENQKYLITIPKDYCRYDPKSKSDQPVLNFLNDSRKEDLGKVVALYEENCEVKKKVINGDLRDSPRSIEVDVKNDKDLKYGKETEYSTRKEIIDLYYNKTSEKVNKETNKKILTQVYEQLTKEKFLGYGFSDKRSEMMREDYKGYAEINNTKIKKAKDEYANYILYFGSNKNFSSYSIQSTTKLYNKTVSVTISRTLSSGNYNRSIANQLIDEAKSYMRNFVSLNDKEDYKEYFYKDKKIKIFTPKDFYYLSKLKGAALKGKSYRNGSGLPGFNFAEVFTWANENQNTATLSIFTPSIINETFDKNNHRPQFIDQMYQKTLEVTGSGKHNNPIIISREKNGLFTLFKTNDLSASAGFTTMINDIPVAMLLEVSHKKDKISNRDIEKMKKDLNDYVDFLDENQ